MINVFFLVCANEKVYSRIKYVCNTVTGEVEESTEEFNTQCMCPFGQYETDGGDCMDEITCCRENQVYTGESGEHINCTVTSTMPYQCVLQTTRCECNEGYYAQQDGTCFVPGTFSIINIIVAQSDNVFAS